PISALFPLPLRNPKQTYLAVLCTSVSPRLSPLIVLDLDLAAAASLSLGPASLTTNEIPKRGARPHPAQPPSPQPSTASCASSFVLARPSGACPLFCSTPSCVLCTCPAILHRSNP